MRIIRSEGAPIDRLTRIIDAMATTMENHPEFEDDRCVIFLTVSGSERGGMVVVGYEHERDAVGDVVSHMKALFGV